MVSRKGLWALAPFVVSLLALAPAPVLAGCEKANLNNPGHHYGLYKNGCHQLLVVTPTPAPAPAPKPNQHPHPTGVVTHLSSTVKPNQSSGLTAVTPQIEIGQDNPPPLTVPAGQTLNDTNLWLVTSLLPTLLVLWLLIAGRTLTEALRRRRRAAATV